MTSLSGQRPDGTIEDARWLRAFVRRLVADEHDADDLGQDVLAAACAAPPARGVDRRWLVAVARNLAATLLRRRARARDERGSTSAVAPAAADLVAEAEQQRRAVTAAMHLPEPYRRTILLRFLRGMTVAEVAAATRVPVETVRTRQRRGLAMLRAELQPRDRRATLGTLGWLGLHSGGAIVMSKKFAAAGVGLAALLLGLAWTLQMSAAGTAGKPPDAGGGRASVARVDAVASGEGPGERVDVPPVGAALATTGPPVAATGVLTVEVVWSDDGAPAEGLPLRVDGPDDPVGRIVRTDAAGKAALPDLRPGQHGLRMLQGNVYRSVTLEAERAAVERIRIPRGHRLTGQVLGPDRAPVPGAEITAMQGGTDPQWVYVVGRADRHGRFAVEGLGGFDLVGARAPGLGASDLVLVHAEVRSGGPSRPLQLVLPGATATLRGRVVDGNGEPVVGAWVRIGEYAWNPVTDDDGSVRHPPPGAILASDADGEFEAAMLRPGPTRLRVHRCGLAPHDATVELQPHSARELVVVLGTGATLTGTVRDAAGAPIAGARVELAESWYPMRNAEPCGADGTFTIGDLPPGVARTFTARASGFAAAERTLTFGPGEQLEVHFRLEVGLALHGRLVDASGRALAGWSLQSDRHEQTARTAPDGRFTFAGCTPTAHTLTVRASFGFEPVIATFTELWPRSDERELVVPARAMPSARARGRCVSARGEPLGGIVVDLRQGSRPVLPGGTPVRTAADGSFETPLLPPGDFELRPSGAGHRFEPVAVELAAGESRDLGLLRAQAR